MDLYDLKEGDSPLILSFPHSGIFVPKDIRRHFTPAALPLPDTDWHVPLLYEAFVRANNITTLKAHYSRYVIDLNRPPDNEALYPGQTKVSLCPEQIFEGQDIYKAGHKPDEKEIATRLAKYWQPYHDALEKQIARVKDIHGYALLYDAHSIRQNLPRLFEGTLPDLNLGTANGASCGESLAQAAFAAAQTSSYKAVLNGRFIGGYITRHYGRPAQNVHALQMELVRGNYMEEEDFLYNEFLAAGLKPVLEAVLSAFLERAKSLNFPPCETPVQGLKPKR
ncbi:MAG: N-formylglutamate deformylase [Alphaproteobacteria bacterium CG_4_9_14_3_um_filter_47_13]|nr:MAG: N-formylglutamate deformylase [Alphaproteobacteria bacterium CG_4_9_14_3_um_filter_47_13]